MNYYADPTFLMSLFIMPLLFGVTLLGEGVTKIMNYDSHGWIGVTAGSCFLVIIAVAFFMFTTNSIS